MANANGCAPLTSGGVPVGIGWKHVGRFGLYESRLRWQEMRLHWSQGRKRYVVIPQRWISWKLANPIGNSLSEFQEGLGWIVFVSRQIIMQVWR